MWKLLNALCTHRFSLFLEEILAYSLHMVRFTLGGGTCSHKLASINTFLVNSLIAARYRRAPGSGATWLIAQVCLQLITQQEKRLFSKKADHRSFEHMFGASAREVILRGASSAQMWHRWRPFQTCFITSTNVGGWAETESEAAVMYAWAWEARGTLKTSARVIHFTPKNPSITSHLCCPVSLLL